MLKTVIVSIFLISQILTVQAKDQSFSIKSFKSMQKKKLKLKAQHDHVFVMYWATWCANCKEKLTKTIPKLKKKYKNIKFIAVNIDQNQKRALHQIEKYQLYKVPHYRNKKLVKKLNVRNSPAWSFFSVKGNKLKLIEHNTGFKLNNIKRKFSSI